MKKFLAILIAAAMVLTMAFTAFAAEVPEEGDKPVIGFVTFGLGGDFFQQLADAYVETMTNAGWEATYTDGGFDPTTQIEQCENYIAQGVDVLVCWSVAPEAMSSVVEQAMNAGIKFIAFVALTEEFDCAMVSDDAKLAEALLKEVGKWLEETYPDAEPGSIPVAVFSERDAETGVVQADVLLKVAEYLPACAEPIEVAVTEESAAAGQTAAENLYISNPEIKLFLTAHGAIGMGIEQYYTALNSPVEDYSDMGIFCINGDTSMAEFIKASAEGTNPFRGMVMTGSVQDTANEILMYAEGVMDGTYPQGYVGYAGTMFVDADTVDEYIENGKVTSVTEADYDKYIVGGEEEAAEGGAVDLEAYHAYLYQWIENENANNDSMDDTMEAEFKACIDIDDYVTFPGDMIFGGMLETGVPMTFDEFVAAGGQY